MKIKNYGSMVPVALVFLMALATYKLISNAQAMEAEYYDYLTYAREKGEEGILSDALAAYQDALNMYPTIEIYDEAGRMIKELGSYKQRLKWGEKIVSLYPDEGLGYEYLMETYLERERYADCFAVYEDARKRKAVTEKMQEIRKPIEYVYELDFHAYEDISIFAGGYCAVCKDGLWGYAGEKGTLQISCQFLQAGIFASGLAQVQDEEGNQFFINTDGEKKLIVKEISEAGILGILNENRYPVGDGKEYYFCNEKGEPVLGSYDSATSFNLGKAAVLTKDGWTFVDVDGNILTNTFFEDVCIDAKGIAFRNSRAFVTTQDGVRMIDENFAIVGDTIYGEARPFYGDIYAAVEVNGKWGFVDNTAKECIPFVYDEADSFMNGYGAVCVDGKWGYINTEGEMVIEPVFEAAMPFHEKGGAFVKQGGEWKMLMLIKDNW